MSASKESDTNKSSGIERPPIDPTFDSDVEVNRTLGPTVGPDYSQLLLFVDRKIDTWKFQIDQKIENATKFQWKFNLIGLAILICGGAGTFYFAVKWVQSKVVQRLDAEFSDEKIKKTIAEAAKKYSEEKAASLIQVEIGNGDCKANCVNGG